MVSQDVLMIQTGQTTKLLQSIEVCVYHYIKHLPASSSIGDFYIFFQLMNEKEFETILQRLSTGRRSLRCSQ